MSSCGQSPPGYPTMATCTKTDEHDRHDNGTHWWSARQQAPVQHGHVHSVELFCTPVCPRWQRVSGD